MHIVLECLQTNLIRTTMETTNFFGVAVAELVIIIILALLIIFRKIGRPLSESEIKERKERQALAEEKFNKQQELRALQRQNYEKKLLDQENAIKELLAPVKLVSVAGDSCGYDLCVVDKNSRSHIFSASSDDMYSYNIPRFKTLFNASHALDGWTTGSILIPG